MQIMILRDNALIKDKVCLVSPELVVLCVKSKRGLSVVLFVSGRPPPKPPSHTRSPISPRPSARAANYADVSAKMAATGRWRRGGPALVEADE